MRAKISVVETRFTNDEQRWDAVLRRDAEADGAFFFAVKTTGVYCRPACAARQPLRENVRFFLTPAEAEQAGFRACKRCKPLELSLAVSNGRAIADACRRIMTAEQAPTLDELASAAGMSKFHFHRLFHRITGVTPRAYAAAERAKRMQSALQKPVRVTDAIYDAGFSSSGRFYAETGSRLGMTPGRYRSGGKGEQIQYAVAQCWLGKVLVAATVKGICSIAFGDDEPELLEELKGRFAQAEISAGSSEFAATVAAVVRFVERPQRGLHLPLDIQGTAFEQSVWQALQAIPAGTTASYAEIAERLGNAKAVRAVARACAANKLAVVVPCHRVVRSDGGLSGYRWGVKRKQALLEREGAR